MRTNSSRRSSKHSSNQVGAPSLPQDRRTKKNQGKSFYSIYRSKIKTLQFVLDHLESSDNIPDAKNRILLLNDQLSFTLVPHYPVAAGKDYLLCYKNLLVITVMLKA